MNSTYDKEKILECVFNPDTYDILAELENAEKDLGFLTNKLKISENQLHQRLSYLIEHDFVREEKNNDKIIFSANASKLADLIEKNNNFDNVVDELTKMDSYLN
jgi:DNA-binding HxlR family transcriptional regulator